MRITVHNLGVLKEASIDLKPLTIFIGPNNSGKTWLAYTLAGLLGSYGSEKYTQAYIEKQVPLLYEQLEQAIERVLTEGSATIDLSKFAAEYGETYFNEVAKYARNWMDEFLDTQFVRFDDLEASIHLTDSTIHFLKNILSYSRRNDIGSPDSLLTIRKPFSDNKVYIYTSSEIQNAENLEEQLGAQIPLEEVRERLVTFIFNALRQSLCLQVRVLPTEKAFFVAGPLHAKMNRETHPIPISDFENMLYNLFQSGTRDKKAREVLAQNDPRIKQYIEFANVLEEQILEGKIDFSTSEPDPRREILFQPTQNVNLEMSIASSMAKELSSLVLYLRLLAQPEELLIIDEPEMNLHPAAQVKMIEFLAMLVNAGLNVLFTTHSPYITDHLTNLIKVNESEDKEVIKDRFFLQNTSAFISMHKVSVYGISEGKVSSVLDEDGFINLNTFGEVSDRVSNIYFAL